MGMCMSLCVFLNFFEKGWGGKKKTKIISSMVLTIFYIKILTEFIMICYDDRNLPVTKRSTWSPKRTSRTSQTQPLRSTPHSKAQSTRSCQTGLPSTLNGKL